MRIAVNGIRADAALAEQHDGHVGEQHAERGAEHDRDERRESRGQHDRRDLRLVAHFGEEERDDGDAEDAPARRGRRVVVVERVGLERPQRDREERQRDEPAQTSRGDSARTRLPTQPASAWFASVATRMPAMIGSGLRKRAASTSARSWVLSPISPSATTPVETRKASMGMGSRKACLQRGICATAATTRSARRRMTDPRAEGAIELYAAREPFPPEVATQRCGPSLYRRCPSTLACFAPLLACAVALARACVRVGCARRPVKTQHVEAELVAARTAIVPGEPIAVALRLEMEKGWHTYWQKSRRFRIADDARLEAAGRRRRPGRSSGPRRMLLPAGRYVNYGYDGEVLLLGRRSPPSPRWRRATRRC